MQMGRSASWLLVGLTTCFLRGLLQAGDLTATLQNVGGANAPAAGTRFVLYTSPSRQISNANPALFTNVAPGTFTLEGYYQGTFWGEEFWASQDVLVSAGPGSAANLPRRYPYASSLLISNATTGEMLSPGEPVLLGTPLRVGVVVANGLASTALNCQVRWVCSRSQSAPYDYDITSSSASVPASGSRLFTLDVTPTVAGQYSFAYRVDASLLNGNTVMVDSAGWQQTFSVTGVLGRIAFHRDSDNHSLHGPVNPDDGNIFVINLGNNADTNVTAGRGLGNCMNPNFSPDGSLLTFMAIPLGQPLSWNNTRIYVLDLAERAGPLDLGSGQDPRFSPDGQTIVYKRADGQLYTIGQDGTAPQILTSGGVERSGPNYSPAPGDGRLVFWQTAVVGSNRYGSIAWRLPDGEEQTLVAGTASRYCYYPVWRDSDHILFTISEGDDNLYEYTVSAINYSALAGLNTAADESDPFPAGDWIGFSSTRTGTAGGGYDLYLAKEDGSPIVEISAANSSLHELGGTFSPYADAQKLVLLAPTNGALLATGSTVMLTAKGFRNGGPWLGAAPKVVMEGPVTIEFNNLHDDGINGDQAAGDGIYAVSATLPAQPGSYSVYAASMSTDNGTTHELRSASRNIRLFDGMAPQFTQVQKAGTSVYLSWLTQSNRTYVLEFKQRLTDATWIPVATNSGTDASVTATNAGATDASRFYRVRVP